MAVNLDKPQRWKDDIAKSVDLYNYWFINFAPKAFREQRMIAAGLVEEAFKHSDNFKQISADLILGMPSVLPILRMACCPPLARERLSGLSYVSKTFIDSLDKSHKIPPKLSVADRDAALAKLSQVLNRLIDPDIFVWRNKSVEPGEQDLKRARTIVADRLCGAAADPIIRNAQEIRQLAQIRQWLERKGYSFVQSGTGVTFDKLTPGQFGFRVNIPVSYAANASAGVEPTDDEQLPVEIKAESGKEVTGVNIPVDVAVMPKRAKKGQMPLLIEAKSAGDYTNVNKRRKEEAKKIQQLVSTYGDRAQFILFLCGYFNSGYLGYGAADGIDWVWEHRIEDLEHFGL